MFAPEPQRPAVRTHTPCEEGTSRSASPVKVSQIHAAEQKAREWRKLRLPSMGSRGCTGFASAVQRKQSRVCASPGKTRDYAGLPFRAPKRDPNSGETHAYPHAASQGDHHDRGQGHLHRPRCQKAVKCALGSMPPEMLRVHREETYERIKQEQAGESKPHESRGKPAN
jgi:hypothetical protein